MGLRRYLAKRLFIAAILFVAVIIFNFFIFRLPVFVLGKDPLSLYTNPEMEEETREQIRKLYGIPERNAGFDIWFQHFLTYMRNMMTFEFGMSFKSFRPVINEIVDRLPNTLILLGAATTLSIIIGVGVGIVAASRHGGRFDTALITISLSLYSFPVFWIGMLLILFFAYYIPLFPLGHSVSPELVDVGASPIVLLLDLAWHLTLPIVALTLAFFGGYMLLMRNTLVEVLTEDYILTAKAKGLPERTVMFKHGLRNAFLPLITVITLSFAYVFSGAVLTETVFNWYGMGRLLFTALSFNDWPVAQAIFFLLSVAIIGANILADVMYGVLDPRIKYG
jgi:peptide/nickel transport system permease protein